MAHTGMLVNVKSTNRRSFKCGCCTLVSPTNGRGRDAERRTLKRRERQADGREALA